MGSISNSSQTVDQTKTNDIQELIEGLPQGKTWSNDPISKYQGIWYPTVLLKPMISFQRNFQSIDSDIILTSPPKSGTTWMKALMFTIINRNAHSLDKNPLLRVNPHTLVPTMEYSLYGESRNPNLENIGSPRLFSTHVHYEALPESISKSKSKIVYVCRNPLDMFVSFWNFLSKNVLLGVQPLPIEEAFEYFINGMHVYGPFWDHILGYWKASLENPEKILFLKYEDLKKNTIPCLKKLAVFLGYGFNEDEEKKGLVEGIKDLCSIQSLRNMEINKTGEFVAVYEFKNSSFFRKGQVGDWVNYLNPAMAERFEKLMKEKLQGTGLAFEP